MKLRKKRTPPPPERRFNLAHPGDEVLFQGTEMEPDEIPLRTKVLLTPLPLVAAALAVEGVKAAVRHHREVKKEGQSKLWDL
jgi:hypothetical protein